MNMTERPRGHDGNVDRQRAEEAIAEGVRARVEAAWSAEEQGRARSPDKRADLARHRFTGLGAGLAILLLGTVGNLQSCLSESSQQKRYRDLAIARKATVEANRPLGEVLLELAATKHDALNPEEFYTVLASIEGSVLDPIAGNILCGEKAKNLSDEPLIEIKIRGKTFKIRKTLAEAVQRASAQMRAEGKGNIDIDYALRYNYEQYLIWLDALEPTKSKPLNTGYAAKPPCLSNHEPGNAIDVNNWREAEPYLWAQGVPGGLHGIPADPRHFSVGEFQRHGDLAALKQWVWWKAKGTHVKWDKWKGKRKR